MKTLLVSGVLATACGLVLAKLPAPTLDDAAKAKADETAAKTAWQGKVDAYQLCKAQDRVAAAYAKSSGKAVPKDPKPGTKDAKPAAAPATAAAAAPAASATAAAAQPAASGTPVSFTPPPACADPGPFAYNAPAEKPLETSGAHSPAGNATSPPSVKQHSAEMAPAKKP
jgi:hypothetical protein